MSRHAWFIFFAYGVTGIAISALIFYVAADYRRLRSALAKFPARESDNSGGESRE